MRVRVLAVLAAALVVLGLVLVPATADPLGMPSNDDFAEATDITSLPFHDEEPVNSLATTEPGEPVCNSGKRTLWWRYTPSHDTILQVAGAQLGYVAIYVGSSLDSLARVACVAGQSTTRWFAHGTTTYYIQTSDVTLAGTKVILDLSESQGLVGNVTNSAGEVVVNECVRAYSPSKQLIGSTRTSVGGDYYLRDLSGDVKLWFGCGALNQLNQSEWYNDKPSFEAADFISMPTAGVLRVDVVLQRYGSVAGTVRNSDGAVISGVCVWVYRGDGGFERGTTTRSDGTYAVAIWNTGDYRVRFGCTGNALYEVEWYDNAPDLASALPVHVELGANTPSIDAQLGPSGSVSGVLRDLEGEPIDGACVRAYRPDGSLISSGNSDGDGAYRLRVTTPSDVKIQFGCDARWVEEWYNDKPDAASADAITVTSGLQVTGIDAQLALPEPPVNDNRASAKEITFPATESVVTYGATVEAGEPTSCEESQGRTVWYRFTSPSSRPVLIFTEQTYFSEFIAVYEGSPEGAPAHCVKTSNAPSVLFSPKPATTYYVQVGDRDSVGGTLNIRFRQTQGGADVTFEAPTACHVQCPYWQETPTSSTEEDYERSCLPEPNSAEGSWDDEVVQVPDLVEGKVPTRMIFRLDPEVDYDSFICREQPLNDSYFVASGANTLDARCPALPLRCREEIMIDVKPGERYVLRAYNWLDGPVADGSYSFIT